MTICITTSSDDPDPQVDARFGRSPYFTFVDTETKETRVEPNAFTGGAHGVGAQSAQYVADCGAHAVITGQVGPNAFRVLEAAGIPAYTISAATVSQAVQALSEGRLERAGGPTGPGHGGRGR